MGIPEDRGVTAIIMSDMHCGSIYGLLPRSFGFYGSDNRLSKALEAARSWYLRKVKEYGSPDLLIHNGDAIEGKHWRIGSRELITADRQEQADMAAECINEWGAKKIVLTRGTGYHTGSDENWEDTVADKVGASIYNMYTSEIEGVILRCRHKISRSSIPHGIYTPIAKEKMWADFDTMYKDYPQTNVMIASHVHYCANIGRPTWEAITTPALQLPGTEFGERACSGFYDFGFLVFKFYQKKFEWHSETMDLSMCKPQIDTIKENDFAKGAK